MTITGNCVVIGTFHFDSHWSQQLWVSSLYCKHNFARSFAGLHTSLHQYSLKHSESGTCRVILLDLLLLTRRPSILFWWKHPNIIAWASVIIRVKLRNRYLTISEYNLHRAGVISGMVHFTSPRTLYCRFATQVFQDSGLMGHLGYYKPADIQSSSASVMQSSTGDGKSNQALDSDVRGICEMNKVKMQFLWEISY